MTISPIENRYKTKISKFFEDEYKLKKWMQVEATLASVQEELKIIPKGASKEITQAIDLVDINRIYEIEDKIHHDLMAMVKALTEKCEKFGGYVHFGSTSYDIEDTATAMILRDAIEYIIKNLEKLETILKKLAKEKKELVCIGRSHGQHAVPMTYGLKFALYLMENKRNIKRLKQAKETISVGKMSGAVGTMATFKDQAFIIQEKVMEKLNLKPAQVTNQVIQRDRHAQVIFALTITACSLEKIAKEIRNLQRTEIMEIAEPFMKKTQVGSSTMPHKRNPHKAERICSLSRILRSNLIVAMENISLEHERDLTNSANERYIFSQSFITLDYMIEQTIFILENLEFFQENINKNLNLTNGLVMAERVMVYLTDIIGRQNAHELIRQNSIITKKENRHLKEVLLENKKIKELIEKKQIDKNEFLNLFCFNSYIGKSIEIVEKVL